MTLEEYFEYRKKWYRTHHISREEINLLKDVIWFGKGWKKQYAEMKVPKILIDSIDSKVQKLKKGKKKKEKTQSKIKFPQSSKRIPSVTGEEYKKISKEFFSSRAWYEIRYKALKRDEGKCCVCGASAKDGVIIHVDHIKSRYLYPELQLDLDNLQTMCEACNIGKGYQDEMDWR
jgi:hypothetical protein